MGTFKVIIDDIFRSIERATVADVMPSLIEFREFVLDLSLKLATWGCTALLLGEYSERRYRDQAEKITTE